MPSSPHLSPWRHVAGDPPRVSHCHTDTTRMANVLLRLPRPPLPHAAPRCAPSNHPSSCRGEKMREDGDRAEGAIESPRHDLHPSLTFSSPLSPSLRLHSPSLTLTHHLPPSPTISHHLPPSPTACNSQGCPFFAPSSLPPSAWPSASSRRLGSLPGWGCGMRAVIRVWRSWGSLAYLSVRPKHTPGLDPPLTRTLTLALTLPAIAGLGLAYLQP